MNRFLCVVLSCSIAFAVCATHSPAQESNSTSILNFARDVQPILESRCLKCHGPDEAKNDFRVDELDSISAYIEPGDSASSSLWTDYLVTDDSEMLMPSATEFAAGGLPGNELAVLKLWLDEGADWGWMAEETPALDIPTVPASLPAKLWAFQGLFHPASVHFPVALLMVSGLFAVLALFRKGSFEYVAYHCLWIGALGAVASSIMGWSYAVHEGYGDGFSLDLQKSTIDRHRWLGIVTAVAAILLIPLARSAVNTGTINKRILWALGSVVIAIAVSFVGYQGGELTYGEDHYAEEFRKLFPEQTTPAQELPESAGNTPEGNTDVDAEANASPTPPAEAPVVEIPQTATAAAAEVESTPVVKAEPDAEAPGDSTVQP